MIAEDAGAAGSGYRDGVRNSSPMLWALIGIAVVAVLAARVSRSFGTIGIIVTVVLVLILIALARSFLGAPRRSGLDRWRAATKNVTPHEPALPGGRAARMDAPDAPEAVDRPPSVIVVEPPDMSEQLTAKLEALDRLKADGVVSEQEYEAKRARLIADF